MSNVIYQHFRKHEHPFIDQVQSWITQVEQTFTPHITDFLDPREQQIISSLIGTTNDDIIFEFFGGTNHSERKRAIIAPYYEVITKDLYSLVLLEATFPEKFISIAHRDILGSFSSLGIDRKKIGDIVAGSDRFQLITTKELAPYVIMNFNQVKNTLIRLEEVALTELLPNNDTWTEKSLTVSSLRLDIIVKEIYQLPRKTAVSLIDRGRVKVNFTEVIDPAITLIEKDLISLRGYGRSKLLKIDGMTRKEKVKINISRLSM